jgi:hypothetical protein
MDVFLFGTSLSVSAYLPRFLFHSKTEQATMFLSLGLSLSLFSLTFLEVMPRSTLILMSRESSLRNSYWVLLAVLSVHILLVLPSLAGASCAESFGGGFLARTSSTNFDRDDRKYPLFNMRKFPWWIRLLLGICQILMRSVYRAICYLAGRSTHRSTADSPSELVMTIHDENEILPSTSMDNDASPASARRSSSMVSLSSPQNNVNHNKAIRRLRARHRFLHVLGAVTGVLTTVFVLSSIGPMVMQPPVDNGTTTLSRIVSWLTSVGLLLSSVLNGFGSVSLPFTYLSGLFLKPLRPETINRVTSELRSMQDSLTKKRNMLREITLEITAPSSRSSGSASMGRSSMTSASFGVQNTFSDLNDDLKNRKHILQTEIDFLEDLVRETSLDLEELKYSQSMAAAARTNMGKFKSWIGILFSIILLVRLLNAGFSVWFNRTWMSDGPPRRSRNDIVTTALLWLMGRNYVSHKRYTMLSQVVSLGLTAILSFSQVRTFLRTVTVVNRRLSKFYRICSCGDVGTNKANNSGSTFSTGALTVSFHSQMIAGFLGCYSLACIVLIKMMLPAAFSEAFSAALAEPDIFVLHAAVVNLVFFSSAVVSTTVLGMLFGIQRQNNLRHASALNDKGFQMPDV